MPQVAEPADVGLLEIKATQEAQVGKKCEIEVMAENKSTVKVTGCAVSFTAEDGGKGKVTLSLEPQSQNKARFTWSPKKEGEQTISAVIEYKNDTTPANNQVSTKVSIKKAESLPQKTLPKKKI